MPATVERWATLLRDTAAPVLRDMPGGFGAAMFRDEFGHRRAVDPLLVAAVRGSEPEGGLPSHERTPEAVAPEIGLWHAVFAPDLAPEPFLSDQTDRRGPLLRHAASTAIEVLTDSDLCGLHAAWTLARLRRRSDLARSCIDAAEWHAAELQPDNATQTPWAIHIFIVLGVMTGSATMLAEAESRLHTCIVSRGKPDRRSALILEHAAYELSLLGDRVMNSRFWFQTV